MNDNDTKENSHNIGTMFDQDTEEDRLERIRQTAISEWEKNNKWGGINRKEACRVGMRAVIAALELSAQSIRKIVAWTERDGDDWIVYDAESETGQHIRDYQKDAHFVSVFPIYDKPQTSDIFGQPEVLMGDGEREALGMLVRLEWIDWARDQPVCKPSWLVPWEELSEADREVDRRIGERIAHSVRNGAKLGSYVDSEHVRRLVGKLDQWRGCMSYNDSYFGEPAGMVKQVVAELAHTVDPIHPTAPKPVDPLAGVRFYTGNDDLPPLVYSDMNG